MGNMKKQTGRPTFLQITLFSLSLFSALLWIFKFFWPSWMLAMLFFAAKISPDQFSALRILLCLGLGIALGHSYYKLGWRLPHSAFLGALLLATFLPHAWVHHRKVHRRENIQATIRKSTENSLTPYAHQEKINWNLVKTDSLGATVTPWGLVVVTSYGIQTISWPILRQAQSWEWKEAAQLVYEVNGRWIVIDTPEEPSQNTAYWNQVLENIAQNGLMKKLPRDKVDRLCLVRKVDEAVPLLQQSHHFPQPKKLAYRGLAVQSLESLSVRNGVTLLTEGIVIRDVCGIQSLNWGEIKGVLESEGAGRLPCLLIKTTTGHTVDPMASSMESFQLSPDDREALLKELKTILVLDQGSMQGIHRVYKPAGPVRPPQTKIYFAAQLTKKP
jgi:hypothetical protein